MLLKEVMHCYTAFFHWCGLCFVCADTRRSLIQQGRISSLEEQVAFIMRVLFGRSYVQAGYRFEFLHAKWIYMFCTDRASGSRRRSLIQQDSERISSLEEQLAFLMNMPIVRSYEEGYSFGHARKVDLHVATGMVVNSDMYVSSLLCYSVINVCNIAP